MMYGYQLGGGEYYLDGPQESIHQVKLTGPD